MVFTGGVWDLARIEVKNKFGILEVSETEVEEDDGDDIEKEVIFDPPKAVVKRQKMKINHSKSFFKSSKKHILVSLSCNYSKIYCDGIRIFYQIVKANYHI